MSPPTAPDRDTDPHHGAAPRPGPAARLLFALARLAAADRTQELTRPVRTLVFAPHPDDEVLGCGGTIALQAAAGAEVRVVVMTDGRASHANLIDAESLVRMRREEAARAAPHLGLRAEHYRFLDFEDHHLHLHRPAAQAQVAQLLADFEPEQVFVPHRRDRLSDHVATFEIVHEVLRARARPVTLLEYPVWLWHTWPWTAGKPREGRRLPSALRLARDVAALTFGCRAHVDVRRVLDHKLAALAEYGSQLRRHRDDPRWPVLADVSDGAFVARFTTGVEVFRATRVGQ